MKHIIVLLFFSWSICNIHVATTLDELNSAVNQEYELTVLYLYNNSVPMDFEHKFKELSIKFEGLVQFYSANCSEFHSFRYCSQFEQIPLLLLACPPEYKINPHTNETMEYKLKRYQEDSLKSLSINDFMLAIENMLPDYSYPLEEDDVDQLRTFKSLNKIMLFTKKKQTPPIYKVLSARLKNKMLVSIYRK